MAFDMGSAVAHIKADISDFQRGMVQAQTGLDGFKNGALNLMSTLGKFAIVAGSAGLATAGIVGKKAIDDAMVYEQQVIALNTLLGDQEKASAHIAKIREDALKTPFNVEGLIRGNQLLISAGVEASKAEQDILNLGDALSANGKGAEELDRTLVNLQQIKNVGKATEMDMKQFAFSGINMYQLLADSTNLPIEKLKDMDISYEMISGALAKASAEGGKYHDANLMQSASLAGLKSNLQDTASQTLVNIANTTGLFDAIKNGTTALISFLEENGPRVAEFINATVEVVRGFVNQMIIFFNEWIKPALDVLVGWFRERWDTISLIIIGAWNIIKGVVQVAWAIVSGLIKVGLALLAGDWSKAWEAIKQSAHLAWEGIKNIFVGALQFIGGWAGTMYRKLVEPFENAWNKIKDLVDKIKGALDFTQRHSPSVVDIVTMGVKKVNQAMDNLDFGSGLMVKPSLAMAGGVASSNINQFTISLDGAIIANEASAIEFSEMVGDTIIKTLQNTIRL